MKNWKVIGVGGAARNALNALIDAGIAAEKTVWMDTHIQAVSLSRAEAFVQLGRQDCKGLGAVEPDVGLRAAQEAEREIVEQLIGTEYLILIAGMGGGCGTGALPYVAQMANDRGIDVRAIVTTPAAFEGNRRIGRAAKGVQRLRTVLGEDKVTVLSIDANGHTLSTVFDAADRQVAEQVRGMLAALKGHA